MQRTEDLLREELRRTDRAPVTSRDIMLARVARVRRRRATVAGLAGVAALAGIVAVTVPMLRPAGPGFGSSLPARLHSVQLVNVIFIDGDNGFVLQERCAMDDPGPLPQAVPTPDVHAECSDRLLATTDAGQTWQERSLPGSVAHKDAGVDIVTGHSLMMWLSSPGTLAVGGPDRRYWTSTDAGLTWQESPTPRAAGPAGSMTAFGRGDNHVVLASYPPLGPQVVAAKSPIVAASDGSFWAECSQGGCVQVTTDGAQNWTTRVVDPAAQEIGWVSTADGQTVYAAIQNGPESQLVRSGDGGLSWTSVTVTERSANGLALANGDVIVTAASEAGGMCLLRAGTWTPELLAGAPSHPNVLYTTGGWIVAASVWDQRETPDLGSVVSLSPDNGATWIAVAPPAP